MSKPCEESIGMNLKLKEAYEAHSKHIAELTSWNHNVPLFLSPLKICCLLFMSNAQRMKDKNFYFYRIGIENLRRRMDVIKFIHIVDFIENIPKDQKGDCLKLNN